MNPIKKPKDTAQSTFDAVASSTKDAKLKPKLMHNRSALLTKAGLYDHKASKNQLYTFTPHARADGTIVQGSLTSKELKSLFTKLRNNKAPKEIYNRIRNSSTNSICPFCGNGEVTEVDHFLPKTRFSSFSIVPLNLVPACHDCNSPKSDEFATSEKNQPIHPYFDARLWVSEQWLFCDVVRPRKGTSLPLLLNFYADPPSHWSKADAGRVHAHFDLFKLGKRYRVVSSSELAVLSNSLERSDAAGGSAEVQTELENTYSDCYKVKKNWWRTAMYQGLSNDSWYCSGGFRSVS